MEKKKKSLLPESCFATFYTLPLSLRIYVQNKWIFIEHLLCTSLWRCKSQQASVGCCTRSLPSSEGRRKREGVNKEAHDNDKTCDQDAVTRKSREERMGLLLRRNWGNSKDSIWPRPEGKGRKSIPGLGWAHSGQRQERMLLKKP